ncbi:MAG: DUF899 domain-containing protein [Gammaproteobacteria bacterium]|nr:DUF899 domain-containing protein [Gammaproteobacteria bacterium]
MSNSNHNRFVDADTWLEARKAFLDKEKAFTRQRDALSEQRRQLPMVQVTTDYTFQTDRGDESLSQLFRNHGQLIVYHFMFGKDWSEGCSSCSLWMDNFAYVSDHLAARDTSFVVVSTADLPTLQAYKSRLGWEFDWVSCGENSFNQDFGVTFPNQEPGPTNGYNFTGKVFGEEMPGTSVFRLFEDGAIGYSYSAYGRGLDILNGTYNLLDLTPKGRDEDDLDYPMAWVKRRDSY